MDYEALYGDGLIDSNDSNYDNDYAERNLAGLFNQQFPPLEELDFLTPQSNTSFPIYNNHQQLFDYTSSQSSYAPATDSYTGNLSPYPASLVNTPSRGDLPKDVNNNLKEVSHIVPGLITDQTTDHLAADVSQTDFISELEEKNSQRERTEISESVCSTNERVKVSEQLSEDSSVVNTISVTDADRDIKNNVEHRYPPLLPALSAFPNYVSSFNVKIESQSTVNLPPPPLTAQPDKMQPAEEPLVDALTEEPPESVKSNTEESKTTNSFDTVEITLNENGKPNVPYVQLIAQAILSTDEHKMLIGEIYAWLMNKYPFFTEKNEKSWRNSVRHNLSLMKCFQKLDRAASGRGNYWGIQEQFKKPFMDGNFSVQGCKERKKCQRQNRKTLGLYSKARYKHAPLLLRPRPEEPILCNTFPPMPTLHTNPNFTPTYYQQVPHDAYYDGLLTIGQPYASAHLYAPCFTSAEHGLHDSNSHLSPNGTMETYPTLQNTNMPIYTHQPISSTRIETGGYSAAQHIPPDLHYHQTYSSVSNYDIVPTQYALPNSPYTGAATEHGYPSSENAHYTVTRSEHSPYHINVPEHSPYPEESPCTQTGAESSPYPDAEMSPFADSNSTHTEEPETPGDSEETVELHEQLME